jgi:hypothetical protein
METSKRARRRKLDTAKTDLKPSLAVPNAPRCLRRQGSATESKSGVSTPILASEPTPSGCQREGCFEGNECEGRAAVPIAAVPARLMNAFHSTLSLASSRTLQRPEFFDTARRRRHRTSRCHRPSSSAEQLLDRRRHPEVNRGHSPSGRLASLERVLLHALNLSTESPSVAASSRQDGVGMTLTVLSAPSYLDNFSDSRNSQFTALDELECVKVTWSGSAVLPRCLRPSPRVGDRG